MKIDKANKSSHSQGDGVASRRQTQSVAEFLQLMFQPTPIIQIPTFTIEKMINCRRQQAEYLVDELGNGIILEMVSIPGGSFLMGSPESEAERYNDESPQHQVTVSPFYMGKYPITQDQWQAVANLPPVKEKLNPNPSNFKGGNRPVECITWYDGVEFCDRLSRETGRDYRLPSEAEWEYACRAGTTTPFYFGETITSDLENYHGNCTYMLKGKGVYREQTTDVGSFPPNAFGLYDIYGNVWEWCADVFHENYQGAPSDGSAWLSGGDESRRMLRGGSWLYEARDCRSALRDSDVPGVRDDDYGLRVACVSSLLSQIPRGRQFANSVRASTQPTDDTSFIMGIQPDMILQKNLHFLHNRAELFTNFSHGVSKLVL